MYMHPKTYLWLQEQDRERDVPAARAPAGRPERWRAATRPGPRRRSPASSSSSARRLAASSPDRPDRSDLSAHGRRERLTLDPAVAPPLGAEGRRPGHIGPYHGEHGPAPEQPDLRRPLEGAAGTPLDGRFGCRRAAGALSSSAARPASARAAWSRRPSRRLRADGWLVIEGGAVALGEDGLPFGPDRRGPPRRWPAKSIPTRSPRRPDRACPSSPGSSPRSAHRSVRRSPRRRARPNGSRPASSRAPCGCSAASARTARRP